MRVSPLARFTAAFTIVGAATTALGPLVPELLRAHGLSEPQAGLLFTAQFLLSVVMSTVSPAVMDRLGPGKTLAAGYLASAVGLVAMGLAGWPGLLVASAMNGVGMGIIIPITNVVAARLGRERASGAVAIVNVGWGVGAVVWPLVVAGVERLTGSYVVATAGLALTMAAAPLVFAGIRVDTTSAPSWTTPVRATTRAWLLPAYAALQFLYVGVETCFGGWTSELVRRLGPDTQTMASVALMAFYLALVAGRAGGSTVLARFAEQRVLFVSHVVVIVAGVAMVLVRTPEGMVVAAVIAGLGMSMIFPITLAGATADLAGAGSARFGAIFALGGMGGASIPWVVGEIAMRTGSLPTGMLLSLAVSVAMMALQAARVRMRRAA